MSLDVFGNIFPDLGVLLQDLYCFLENKLVWFTSKLIGYPINKLGSLVDISISSIQLPCSPVLVCFLSVPCGFNGEYFMCVVQSAYHSVHERARWYNFYCRVWPRVWHQQSSACLVSWLWTLRSIGATRRQNHVFKIVSINGLIMNPWLKLQNDLSCPACIVQQLCGKLSILKGSCSFPNIHVSIDFVTWFHATLRVHRQIRAKLHDYKITYWWKIYVLFKDKQID